MIFEEIRKIKSAKSDLRKFGITMSVFFGALGTVFLWKQRALGAPLLVLSPLFLLAAWRTPHLLKPIQKVWMAAALFMGGVMTRVILTLLFYLVMTPLGLLTRVFGKDFLNRKFREPKDSYWINREDRAFNREEYEKQF